MVGNVQGDKGDSLVVEMNGEKAGLWHDFATGVGGDIIDLWATTKGFDRQTQFPVLLQDIQTHLGAGIDTRPYKPPSSEQQGQNRKLGKPTAKWDYGPCRLGDRAGDRGTAAKVPIDARAGAGIEMLMVGDRQDVGGLKAR